MAAAGALIFPLWTPKSSTCRHPVVSGLRWNHLGRSSTFLDLLTRFNGLSAPLHATQLETLPAFLGVSLARIGEKRISIPISTARGPVAEE